MVQSPTDVRNLPELMYKYPKELEISTSNDWSSIQAVDFGLLHHVPRYIADDWEPDTYRVDGSTKHEDWEGIGNRAINDNP